MFSKFKIIKSPIRIRKIKNYTNAVVYLTLVYLFSVADASYLSNILIDSKILGELGYYFFQNDS